MMNEISNGVDEVNEVDAVSATKLQNSINIKSSLLFIVI